LTSKPFQHYQFSMTKLKDLSTDQIRSIIIIKKKIGKLQIAVERRVEKLQSKIDSIAGGGGGMPSPFTKRKKHRMSRAGRAAIAAAARARWARYRGKGAKAPKPARKKRKVSAAVKAKLAAIAKARWAKAKAAGKKAL